MRMLEFRNRIILRHILLNKETLKIHIQQNKIHYDLSPITIIKNMKKKTDENTPFIYENYNINRADKYILEKSLKSIDIYLRHRKFLLLTLQKMVKIFDYCDIVFYQCLFYLDTYLSHNTVNLTIILPFS